MIGPLFTQLVETVINGQEDRYESLKKSIMLVVMQKSKPMSLDTCLYTYRVEINNLYNV